MATAALLVLLCGALPHALAAATPSAVQLENAQPGTTAWQRTLYSGVDVYADAVTAAPGDPIGVHVSTAYRYRLVVYRLGWYGGTGARLMACVPSCAGDEQGRVLHGDGAGPGDVPQRAGWPQTDVVQTGYDWTSGYYLVEAELTSGSVAGRVATTYVVLRQPSDQSPAQILVQVPVNTWEAYNTWGGKSLYNFAPLGAVDRVSFDRPFDHQASSPLWWEIQTVRFLEREGYDVAYQTDVDTDSDPAACCAIGSSSSTATTSTGRSRCATASTLRSPAATNLAFMGTNDAYWNVRYEDGGRTIVAYKSLYDPNPDPTQKTAMFREIGRPECLLLGVQHAV